LFIVIGTFAWSAVLHLSWALFGPARGETPARAGRDLGKSGPLLGSFRLVERSGETLGDQDLADRVWIASFIFTRCPASCPKISATMRSLQDRLTTSDIRLVSISVDPQRDTPEVLSEYARTYGADPDRWSFLTGSRDEIYELILKRFLLPVSEATAEELAGGSEAILHSDRLVLVDRGNRVAGYYSSNDADAIKELIERASLLDSAGATSGARSWVRRLPDLNAVLNSVCALLLVGGWSLIRSGRSRGHMICMISAVIVSAAFLTSYLIYHFQVGSVPFRGVGPIRSLYFTILLSHTILAAAMVPLVVLTLVTAIRRRFESHTRYSRVLFPIWLYVSITGVVIYLMLYQLPMPTSPLVV
jgi:protein SCO1/2/putative membrane protein